MSELPSGWALAALSDLCKQPEQRVPHADEMFTYIDIASVDRDLKTVSEPQRLLGADAPSRARKLVEKGDVIVSMTRPNLNAVALIGEHHNGCIASTGFDVLKPIEVEPRWIFSAVRSARFVDAMCEKVQGALYPAVKSADIREHEIPLPPLAEQTRIAQKLDELLAQVDTLKARIDAIPALLKRFRQSVLAAAVSGRLTEGWRQLNSAISPQLAGLKAEKINHAFEIPDSWLGVSLGSISKRVSVGHVGKTSEYYAEQEIGIPFLRSQNVRRGQISLDGLAYISKDFHKKLKKSQLQAGDLLVVRVGANRGDACVLPQIFEEVNCANIVFARPSKEASAYLNIYFQSAASRELLLNESVGGAQGVINTKSVAETFVALPPQEEQTEIVRRVEQLFAFADQLEAKIKTAQARVNHLTQSILAKAFRGELVPQDPNDEPASVLLERIKAQRAAAPKAKRGRKASA